MSGLESSIINDKLADLPHKAGIATVVTATLPHVLFCICIIFSVTSELQVGDHHPGHNVTCHRKK